MNTIAGKGMSTHVSLVLAICERLQQAGIKPGDIIIWDRTSRELERAGYTISTDPNRVRCFGTDMAGLWLRGAATIIRQSFREGVEDPHAKLRCDD